MFKIDIKKDKGSTVLSINIETEYGGMGAAMTRAQLSNLAIFMSDFALQTELVESAQGTYTIAD